MQFLKAKDANLRHRYQTSVAQYDNYLFKYICELHNVTANISLNYTTPHEKIWRDTPDISHFRFKLWDLVLYLEPNKKKTIRKMLTGRFLGFAGNVGDASTFYVLTVLSNGKRQTVIARSVVTPRLPGKRANRSLPHKLTRYYFPTYSGQSQSSVNSSLDIDQDLRGNDNSTANLDPQSSNKRKRSEDHTQLKNSDIERIRHQEKRAESQPIRINTGRHDANVNNHESSDEDSTSKDELNAQTQNFDDGTSNDVEIMSTYWCKSNNRRPKLYFKRRYSKGRTMWISFEDMKIGCPNTTTKFIITRKTGGQKYKTPLKGAENHIRSLRRVTAKMVKIYGTTRYTQCWGDVPPQSDQHTQELDVQIQSHNVRSRISKKRKKTIKKIPCLKYEIRVPKDTEETYRIDKGNNNNLWREAINKELNALNSYKTFKFVHNTNFKSLKNKWCQFARLKMMIFDIKQDLRRKARLVIGGNMVDSTGHEIYTSVIKQHSHRIIEVSEKANDLVILVIDIGNAYLYANTREKIFTRCDQSFLKAGLTTEDKSHSGESTIWLTNKWRQMA